MINEMDLMRKYTQFHDKRFNNNIINDFPINMILNVLLLKHRGQLLINQES